MKGPLANRFRRLATVALAAGLATAGLAACSSGSSGGSNTASASGTDTNITIGVLISSESVPLQIAIAKGYFKQQGLNVKVVDEATTDDATTDLAAHTVDFSTETYTGMFQQEEANPSFKPKVVVDNDQSSPNSVVMLVPKNSPITSIAQLKGKTLGFPALGFNVGAVDLAVLGQAYGLSSLTSYKSVVVPFADGKQELAEGDVDAVMEIEPFITIDEEAGDRILVDLASGPTADFPSTCWITSTAYAQANPKTVLAFQRAMTEAVQLAGSDPAYVRQELPRYVTTMKPALAGVITLPFFNATVSKTRLTRVATVMQQVGALPDSFNITAAVNAMYDPMPAGS